MKINFLKRKCLICGNLNKLKLEIYPDIDPKFDEKIIKFYWAGFYKENVFFPYYRCNCGFLLNKFFPDESSLKKLYSNQNDNVIYGDVKLDLKTKLYYLNQLKEFLPDLNKDYKILEIGADNGSFIKLLGRTFKNANFYSIEPNINMQKNLKKLTKKNFISLHQIKKNIKFDLIIGIHTFDHIPRLNEYFLKLNNHLKVSGLIFGVVHDENSYLAKIFKKKWPIFRLQHPHLFNHHSINSFFNKFNLEKIFIKKTKNFFNVGFLINQFFLSIFKIKINFPKLFSLGIKLGNFSFLYKKNNHL